MKDIYATIIISCRVKDNPDSSIGLFMKSTVECLLPNEHVEILFKFDSDDDMRPSQEHFDNTYKSVRVKCFSWSRGEGRHATHHVHEYLFSRADPRSELIMVGCDDCFWTRRGFLSEAYEIYQRKKYCMITGKGPCLSLGRQYNAGPAPEFYSQRFADWESRDHHRGGDYNHIINARIHATVLPGAIFSKEFLEVAQNFGWQTGTDSWCAALEGVFYDMFGFKLWSRIDSWYERTGGSTSYQTGPFYNEMQLLPDVTGLDPRYIELMRRQAKNIYLNIVNDGLLSSHMVEDS